MGTEWCTILVRCVAVQYGGVFKRYAGASGGVGEWRQYNTKAYKLSINMTIQ